METVLNNLKIESDAMVCAKTVPAGTTLLTQPPLALIPQPAIRQERCNYCLCKTSLQCCSRCRSAYFCSNECFRNAWLHFHRVLCEPQEYDIYTHVDADRWLLERAALTLHSHERMNKHHSSSPPHLPLAIQALDSLAPPPDSRTTTPDADIAAVAETLEPFGCRFTRDELASLWRRLQLATFDILDHDQYLEPIALGIYPLTARYIGHSCRPNAGVVYKRGAQILVALDEIRAGEPVTINYVDLVATKAERLDALRRRFGPGYVCKCSRCTGEFSGLDLLLDRGEAMKKSDAEATAELEQQCKTWSILDMVKAYSNESRTPNSALDIPNFAHYTSRIMEPDIYRTATNRRRQLSRHQLLPDKHSISERILRALYALVEVPSVPAFTLASIRSARKLLVKLMAENRWVEASRCAVYLFVVYRLIYPTFHPVLSYHSLILARSSWNSLVQLELAGIGRKLERIYEKGVSKWIAIAKEAVMSTFGQDCSLWREIVELQWVFERDQKLK